MILNAIAAKLQRRSKDDFKGRHFEATLILQAVSWYLRYPLSYRDIEELFRERGLEVDHSTLNRWPEPLGAGLCAVNREEITAVPQATVWLDPDR
jgi:transposase-like protein